MRVADGVTKEKMEITMSGDTFNGTSGEAGLMPKDLLGLSDNVVEGIYGQAYRLYNAGKYHEACQLFRLLLMLNSTVSKYSLGLAACFHMLKEYKSAAATYGICAVVDSDSPVPYFHASDCYMHLRDPASALAALEIAVKRAGNKPEHQLLKDRALMTMQHLKEEIAKQKGCVR